MLSRLLTGTLLACVALSLTPTAALADDRDDLLAAINKAEKLAEEVRYDEAAAQCEKALQLAPKVFGENHAATAVILNNLANLYQAQGKYAAAEPLYTRALAIWEKVYGKDHPDVATSLNNLANLYAAQGKYAAAERLLTRALAIREKVLGKEHPAVADSLFSLALLYAAQGKYAAAERLLTRALAIREKVHGKDHPEVADLLNCLAVLYWLQGKYAAAEPLSTRALAIREKVLGKEHPFVADSLHNLALLYWAQGKYAAAEPLYSRALAIREKALGKDHRAVAGSLHNLAILSADQGKYSQAAEFQTRLRRSTRLFLLRELPSLSAKEQKQWLDVAERTRMALALSLGYHRRDDADMVIASAGWLLNGKAIAVEAQTLRGRLDREVTDPDGKRLLAAIKELRSQESALALKTGTAEQRQELEGRRRELEKRLAQKSSTAAQLADPWVPLDAVRKAIPANGVLVDIARFQPYRFEVKPGGQRWDDAERYVAWVIPAQGAIRSVDLGKVKPIDEAIAAATRDIEGASRRLVDRKKDGQVIQAAEDEDKVEAQTAQKLAAVAKLVFEPLKPHLGKATKLILSPDGDLWLLPWAALPVARNRYLIEDYTLQLVISGRDLVEPAQVGVPIRPTAAVIVADPDYDRGPARGGDTNPPRGLSQDAHKIPKAPRLPGTADEARAAFTKLKAFLPAEPKVYLQRKATKGVVLETRSPEVLALMTHGFFLKKQEIELKEDTKGFDLGGAKRSIPVLKDRDGKEVENPLLRCGLLFAGANRWMEAQEGDDGILTGQEIVSLDLRGTRLVVLSACETAVGETNTGEGVAGLRQAFQLAGAESVLATLWQIDDTATVRLMNPFYERLAKSPDRAAALAQAQRQFIAERRKRYGAAHPYFWAAFSVTGR